MPTEHNLRMCVKTHPADELWGWLVLRIAEVVPCPNKIDFVDVKRRLHELYDEGKAQGFLDGREEAENTYGEWHKPL